MLNTDKDRALNDVKSAIDRITSFPEDVERPTVSLLSNRQQVISLVLYGDVDEATLRAVGENSRRALLQDPRITYVELSGIRPLEISIEVPQAQLRKHGLTLDEVAARVRAASVELPGGGVKTQAGEVLLRTTERRDRGNEFGNIILLSEPDGSQVRVRDVATVRDGFREIDKEATYNGKRAVMINVFRVGNETPLTVSAAAKEYVESFRAPARRPERGDLVRHGRDVRGATLAPDRQRAHRSRPGPADARPVSRGASRILGDPRHPDLVRGLAALLPGDRCVDQHDLALRVHHHARHGGRRRHRGRRGDLQATDGRQGALEAAIGGAKEVAQPVIFAILTSCVAFAPMLMVPGPMGKFFRVVPIVVIAVLLISLVESLLILPAHLSHPMPWWLRVVLSPYLWVMRVVAKLDMAHRLQHHIQHTYVPILQKALRWRYFTIAAGVALLVGTMGYVAGRIPFTFLPKVEGDLITAHLKMPVGTPVPKPSESRTGSRALRSRSSTKKTPSCDGRPFREACTRRSAP